MKSQSILTLSLTAFLAATNASADQIPVPRGGDIGQSASNCAIGPFGQTGKAGGYNPYCSQLTDAEKCLALVKSNMRNDTGVLYIASNDQDRVAFCLQEFSRGLLGQ